MARMNIIESNNGKEAVDWFLRKMTSLKNNITYVLESHFV